MKMPIEAVVVLLKNTIRRVFDEKLVYIGVFADDHEINFLVIWQQVGFCFASIFVEAHKIIFFGNLAASCLLFWQ